MLQKMPNLLLPEVVRCLRGDDALKGSDSFRDGRVSAKVMSWKSSRMQT